MYLKRLEMQGFKSFADKTVFEFKEGITGVIGPNGSGKSNISDAIRWVLGEQSMKSLRGAKSEDIIFAGTQNRKSLGFAEVNMVIDNEDGSLPIEYSEVTVTRRIYRTGEAGYFINKVPCRLKDILELFMDTGIGKDGYSIIGQGKIDEILSNKSEDRRHIFEEAAGIVKYRTRRDETEKKLEQTKVNLIRINDILAEIEANIEPLKNQAEKAKKFLSLREELKSVEVGLFVYKIDLYKKKLVELAENKEIFENQINSEEEKLNKLQKLKEELKEQIELASNEIERIQTLGFESKNKIEKLNSDINISKEKIFNNLQNKERLESEINQGRNDIEHLKEERQAKVDKKANLENNKEKFEKELKEKEEKLNKLTEKLTGKELEIEGKKKIVDECKEEKYNIQNEITEKEVNFANLENRQKQAKRELDKTISELDEKRTEKNNFNIEFLQIETEKKENEERLTKEKKIKEELENNLKIYDEKIIKLTDEKRLKQTKCNFLIETEKEKEGYIKAVKELLLACEKDSNLKKGIHGVLANIISVEDKYKTAIEMCLGVTLQNIVTDEEKDAKKLIEHLRKNNLGRASFLPISAVHGKKLEKIKSEEGVIGIASDLVKYDKKYDGIVQNLLGRTVIAKDMDTAIKLAKGNNYGFRIVTLEGDVINASGAITGGSNNKKTSSIIGRSDEIKKLKNNIENLEKEIQLLEEEKKKEQEKNNTNALEENIRKLQEIEIVYATKKEKLNQLEEAIQKLVNEKEQLANELDELEAKKKECIEKKEILLEKTKELNVNIENLTKEIEEFAKTNKDEQKYIDDLNLDVTNLKISVSSFDESSFSINELVERIEQSIQNQEDAITNKKDQISDIEKQSQTLRETIVELESSISRISLEVEGSSEKIESLKQDKTNKNNKLLEIEQDVEKQFEIIQGVKEQLVKINLKETNINQDITDTINELWNEYEITPNNAKDYKLPENLASTQKTVAELHNKIKDLGSVNIDSIEEYKKTKERYETMSEQRLDLENAISKLRNVITEMTSTMKTQFVEKFKLINKNFNEVFTQLFGGGKAELSLEDEANVLECGIEIKVQPTGKKLQNMMLLSGGEKALTAIALLFAILQINPAPFCILDEIEAALDDANVYRFAEYLKKFSKGTQFLVITHRKGTMEAADTVYGVTMEESGISKLLSIKLKEE